MAEIDPRTKAVNTAVRDAAIRIVDVALGQGAIRPEHAGRLQRRIYHEVIGLWEDIQIVDEEPRHDESLGYDWMKNITN